MPQIHFIFEILILIVIINRFYCNDRYGFILLVKHNYTIDNYFLRILRAIGKRLLLRDILVLWI